jgi:hypothetical protein
LQLQRVIGNQWPQGLPPVKNAVTVVVRQ